jgi:hypothetical protein
LTVCPPTYHPRGSFTRMQHSPNSINKFLVPVTFCHLCICPVWDFITTHSNLFYLTSGILSQCFIPSLCLHQPSDGHMGAVTTSTAQEAHLDQSQFLLKPLLCRRMRFFLSPSIEDMAHVSLLGMEAKNRTDGCRPTLQRN